jgi:transcriptional regulator with XRE-family HTH domain
MANDNRSDDRQAEMRAWMRGVLHERNRARGRGKRKGRRLSQAGLADVLGIDPSGVSRTINDGTAKDPPWFVTLDFLLGFARYTGEDIPIRFLAGFDVARLEGLLVSGREIQAPSDTEPKLVPAPSWPDGTLLAVRVVGDAGRPDYGDGVLLYYPPADGPPHDSLIGWECVCRTCDGRILLRTLQRGSRPGLWRLDSPTTASLVDVELESASPVLWTARTPPPGWKASAAA